MTTLEEWATSLLHGVFDLDQSTVSPIDVGHAFGALAQAILKDSTNVEKQAQTEGKECKCGGNLDERSDRDGGSGEVQQNTGCSCQAPESNANDSREGTPATENHAVENQASGTSQLGSAPVTPSDETLCSCESNKKLLKQIRKAKKQLNKGKGRDAFEVLEELGIDVAPTPSEAMIESLKNQVNASRTRDKGGRMNRKELIKYLKDRESQWEKRRVELEGGDAAATPHSITYANASMHMCREIRMRLEVEQ